MKWLLLLCVIMSSCGVDEMMSDTKIVGGVDAPYKRFYGRMEVNNRFRCGSTLIEKRFVLTAKHCIPSAEHWGNIKIRLGAYEFSAGNGGKPFDLVDVQDVYLHPAYDLALLELARPSRFKPIGYSENDIPDRANLRAFGFGTTKWQGSIPNRLQAIVLKHIKDGGNRQPRDHMVYVGGGVGKDVCHGDSGGPLIYRGNLVGVASWTGSRCGTGDSIKSPSGYVKPDKEWLREIIH